VTGWLEPGITAVDVAAAGAKRISVGGALNRLARLPSSRPPGR